MTIYTIDKLNKKENTQTDGEIRYKQLIHAYDKDWSVKNQVCEITFYESIYIPPENTDFILYDGTQYWKLIISENSKISSITNGVMPYKTNLKIIDFKLCKNINSITKKRA